MNARGLRRYLDDLLRGRKPSRFTPDDFDAAQMRTAIDLQAARPGADENNFTQPFFRLMQFFFQRLIGGGFISGNHQTGKTAIEDPLPEVPPCCRRRQMRFDMMPPVAGRLGDASQVSGQQRFDFFANQPGQYRC